MKNIIDDFIKAKNQLNKHFKCEEQFFIKTLIDSKWKIKDGEGVFFLTYFENNKQNDCVIVKKNNKPMIYKEENFTMVVGIECIKLAFILKNDNEIK